jgi:nitrate reductase gamma subunit
VLELLPDPVYVGPLAEGKSFGFGVLIYYLTVIAAAAGLGLATLGVLGLLQIRLTDRVMKNCTSASHIFNLLFFLTVLVLGWIIMTAVDPGFSATRSFLQSLIVFDLGETPAHPVLFAEVILTVLLIAYIPMTHMSHFFMKWFTYHKVRWDDEPNVAGGMVERKVARSCTYPVTWAAPHINADGKKNWVDIATEEIE